MHENHKIQDSIFVSSNQKTSAGNEPTLLITKTNTNIMNNSKAQYQRSIKMLQNQKETNPCKTN